MKKKQLPAGSSAASIEERPLPRPDLHPNHPLNSIDPNSDDDPAIQIANRRPQRSLDWTPPKE